MNTNPIGGILERFGYVPDSLRILFEQTKKADLERYTKNLTIRASEFAALTFSSEQIGYFHQIKTFEYVPEQLRILPGESFSNQMKPGQILTGPDLRLLNKIKGIFEQRRHSIAHLFVCPERWHIFYFDFRDIEDQTKNHWKAGSHIHFVNYLWPNLRVGEVWESLAGRSNKSYGIHIRWLDNRNSDDAESPLQTT